jgi:D-alanine-D-alanine ligase
VLSVPQKMLAVIFGGRSGEHVVSLRSAESIMKAVDRERYRVIQVGITREGRWITGDSAWQVLRGERPLSEAAEAVLLTDPSRPGLLSRPAEGAAWTFQPLDLAFPVLHGPFGEDGTVQGLLELAGIPYVGSGVLASAVSMDKVVMKILFQKYQLPVAPYLYFYRWDWKRRKRDLAGRIAAELGYPCFVKPANLGSSVGISRVIDEEFFSAAVDEALLYDDKVVVEKAISGREIECSVIGDLEPRASRPGEIIPCNEFYDYRAKYLDDRSLLIVPVELGEQLEEKIKELACAAFKAVEASGLARVDFFVNTDEGQIVINEINTIPGFTSISMYPKLWEVSGISYGELINQLLALAESRFQRRRALRTAPPE